MPFSAPQIRKLRTHVRAKHIRERAIDGKILPYVEASHVIAEANRIFGHDGWDRETLATQCIWQKQAAASFGAAYVARVRITVRADGATIVREGFGAGEAFAATPGQAHERAVKTAETDATKRALTTFGNCFGLALYQDKTATAIGSANREDKAQSATIQSPSIDRSPTAPAVVAKTSPYASDGEVQKAAEEVLDRASSETAAENPRQVAQAANNSASQRGEGRHYLTGTGQIVPRPASSPSIPSLIDKSELLLGEPKRVRNSEHLRFVEGKPCLVCGRRPSDAHHLRFTQPPALGKKVSDEFTVPLCRFHHDEVHRAGKEITWWQARGIEPLAVARDLWVRSRTQGVSQSDSDELDRSNGTTSFQPRRSGS